MMSGWRRIRTQKKKEWIQLQLFLLGVLRLTLPTRMLSETSSQDLVFPVIVSICGWSCQRQAGEPLWTIPASRPGWAWVLHPAPEREPGHTLVADFTRPDKVALVPHQDDWHVWLGLPEEEAELGGPMEASSVSHGEDENAHVTLQRGQVLRSKHMNKRSCQQQISARQDRLSDSCWGVECQTATRYKIPSDFHQSDNFVVSPFIFF